jgi:DNA polymerase III subunit delta
VVNLAGGNWLLHILWGEDEFSRLEALTTIKSNMGGDNLMPTNTNVLEGQKLTVNELRANIETLPFLTPHRLVIINGLLERFEPKEKTVRTTKKDAKSDEVTAMANSINSMPPSTILVLSDGIVFKKPFLQNNPLFTAISAKAEVKSFPALKSVKLSQWIQERVSRYSSSISVQATNLLMNYVGGDLFAMSNEIQKLAAYTAGRKIEEKDVRMLVAASQDADIFALIDAVLDHKTGQAEQVLLKLLQKGVVAPQILVLLARQVQMMVQVKEMRASRRPTAEIQTRLGIFSPYAWERLTTRSERYSFERLRDIYNSLLETDISIKSGRFDGDLAINILAAELCQYPDC